ncbi:MAG: CGNR zinc finger domain-containing protein [Caulobacteraceae bacterium]
MPEHREGTPQLLGDLESFLWWDFDPETWRAWADKRGFSTKATVEDFAEAQALQAALRHLQRANNGDDVSTGDAVKYINRALACQGVVPEISPDLGLAFTASDTSRPVGSILVLFVEAMTLGTWPRFKLCRDEVCRASYFDASKNNSKTWCSMEACGSRNKMRRLRARRLDGPTLD